MGRDWQQSSQPETGPSEAGFPDAALVIQRGVAQQRERRIELGVFTLGSGKDCDLILGDPQFPELFAYVLRTEGGYRLRCLVPDPVLTVNAEDVVAVRLEEGDRIRCGPYEFRFRQIAASPNLPAEAVRPANTPSVPTWTATDGQSVEGVAASRQLIEAIQQSIMPSSAPAVRHRRSA